MKKNQKPQTIPLMSKTSPRVQTKNQVTAYLKKKGLKILRTNLRTKLGETSILAEDGQTLVVVEIITVPNKPFGGVTKVLSKERQERLLMIARKMQVKYNHQSVRIDVIAVGNNLKIPIIKYYRGIIESHV